MSINNEVIKFQVIQSRSVILIDIDLSQFILCREKLQKEKLIGRIETGKFAGYDCGNISIRISLDCPRTVIPSGAEGSVFAKIKDSSTRPPQNFCGGLDRNDNYVFSDSLNGSSFYIAITGSQTSSKKEFTLSDMAVIENYEPKIFAVRYSGIAVPSSETPLHWTACEADHSIGAIIHAHISEDSPLYEHGPDFFLQHRLPLTHYASKSVEIGEEIARLIKKRGCSKIVGMLNHDGGFGLLSFGENLEEAHLKLLTFHSQLKKAVR